MIGIFHARSVVLILLLSAAAPDSALAGCRIKDMLLGTSSRDSSHKAETLDFGSLASDSHYYSAEKLRQLYERAHPKGHATQEQKRELMSGALVDTQDLLFKRRELEQEKADNSPCSDCQDKLSLLLDLQLTIRFGIFSHLDQSFLLPDLHPTMSSEK